MAVVPMNSATSAQGSSPMLPAKPSDTDLLMAAATMHSLGKFDKPEKMPMPKSSLPTKPR